MVEPLDIGSAIRFEICHHGPNGNKQKEPISLKLCVISASPSLHKTLSYLYVLNSRDVKGVFVRTLNFKQYRFTRLLGRLLFFSPFLFLTC